MEAHVVLFKISFMGKSGTPPSPVVGTTCITNALAIQSLLLISTNCDDIVIFPIGGVAEDEEYLHVVEALFAIYTVLSIFGIIFAVICLVFNLWFRKQKYVIRSCISLGITI